MNVQYICNHILQTVQAQVRQYRLEDGNYLPYYIVDPVSEDVVKSDNLFAEELFSAGHKDYPVIYMEKHPIYYAVLQWDVFCFIIGPVNVEKQTVQYEGMPIETYIAKRHKVKEINIPYCPYKTFCEETLLLFHALTGKEMTYQQLNEKNFMTEELLSSMKYEESKLFFHYQEYSKKHNPYDREVREMESIRSGNVDRLRKSINEVFAGEYAVLSKNSLQAAKNLAIVGLAISARAAIAGGIHFEEAFSINDSYIRKVDESTNVGEIEGMVQMAKIQYAEMVRNLSHTGTQNPIIEKCKNLIFKNMHTKIVIRDLAEELNISKEYLSTLFKREEGVNITDYIMKRKITLAENMLIYSDYSTEQIGMYLGFSSQSHFGSIFKRYNHITPGQYKNLYGKKSW